MFINNIADVRIKESEILISVILFVDIEMNEWLNDIIKIQISHKMREEAGHVTK